MRLNRITALLLTTFAVLQAAPAAAQTFPTRPIQMILGDGAGGPADILLRKFAPLVEKRLGQPLLVEQRPGAQLSIAANAVAKAAPDGHTLFFGVAHTFHPVFIKNNSVVASRDMSAVSNSVNGTLFVLISAKAPFSTMADMVAYAKANPGKINHGAISFVNEAWMKMLADRAGGFTFTHINYKGVGDVVTALISGEAHVIAGTSLVAYAPHIKAGTIKPLMAIAPKRFFGMPDLPTSGELGIKNYDTGFHFGVWGPAALPRPLQQRLSTEFASALKVPEIVEFTRTLGLEADGSTPEEQLRAFEQEMKFWTEAARVAKFDPQ